MVVFVSTLSVACPFVAVSAEVYTGTSAEVVVLVVSINIFKDNMLQT